jgi:hypothetical protein
MNEYIKQAESFLKETGSNLEIEFLKNDFHFQDKKNKRDIYKCTLSRGERKFTFNFGQSIVNSQKYVDQLTLNEFTTNGQTIKGNKKVIIQSYLTDYCQLVKGKKPTSYDILSCLQTYPVDTFEDFCAEFGYDNDSIKAMKVYEAVKDEYNNLCRLYTDQELELLSEIQ